jgi:hypothetical protein
LASLQSLHSDSCAGDSGRGGTDIQGAIRESLGHVALSQLHVAQVRCSLHEDEDDCRCVYLNKRLEWLGIRTQVSDIWCKGELVLHFHSLDP